MDGRAPAVALALVGLFVACSPPFRERPRTVQASAPETEEAPSLGDVLATLNTVYVPIDPGSLQSLDDALEAKGYGNVKVSDLKRKFIYERVPFGEAMVAYSSDGHMAPNSLYEAMPPSEWLQFALSDKSSSGVVLDPGRRPVVLEKKDIAAVLARLQN